MIGMLFGPPQCCNRGKAANGMQAGELPCLAFLRFK